MNDIFSITIGRELGSGGQEIAKILADKFSCQLYDKEILTLAAKDSGFTEKLFIDHDERHGKLHNLLFNKVPIIGHANYYNEQISQGSLFKFQSDAILQQAQDKRCIFVGRCADYVLREMKQKVRIFIYADLEYRIQQVMARRQCNKATAQKIIRDTERKRADYYNYYTGQQWGDKFFYDLCINSCTLGINGTAEFLAEYIKKVLL